MKALAYLGFDPRAVMMQARIDGRVHDCEQTGPRSDPKRLEALRKHREALRQAGLNSRGQPYQRHWQFLERPATGP